VEREDREVERGPGWPVVESGGIDRPAPPKPERARRPLEEERHDESRKPATVSQNEMLFMRGNAMSGAPIISGTNQFPNPPISAGMTRKNTMIRPWPVTNTL
jgi:hypothetical protein